MFKIGLDFIVICHTIKTMIENKYQRKLLSVSFRPEEWDYILKHLPAFTNFIKFTRELILRELHYPTAAGKQNKTK